jgi:uncharacterized protein YndB with AHSA1/START domain
MHGPDGNNYPNKSVFDEIVPNEKIVFTHLSGHVFKVTAIFEKRQENTFLTFQMVFDSEDECKKVKSFILKANEENLDRLEEVLKKI